MDAIKERIDEILDDMKGRIRNPLLTSFILVWLYFHWRLVYKIFTIEGNLPVNTRISIFNNYIIEQGPCKMLVWPILAAFISLIVYYLIAVIAQLIKLGGKYLYSFVLAKIDKPNFVSRSEYEIEKKHVRLLKTQVIAANEENRGLSEFKDTYSRNLDGQSAEIISLQQKLKDAIENTAYNLAFQNNFEYTLMYLLAKSEKIQGPISGREELIVPAYGILKGSYKILLTDSFRDTSGQLLQLTFDSETIKNLNGSDYAEIKSISFDRTTQILRCSFRVPNSSSPSNLVLVKVRDGEFMGYLDGKFAYFNRESNVG